MRIAFFGGSFDPPHRGHLAIARAARDRLALDQVLLAPVGLQPLKRETPPASFEDRLAMLRLLCANEPGVEVSELDAPRLDGLPNYSYETLTRLRTRLGLAAPPEQKVLLPDDAAPPDVELFMLLGADSFLMMRQWHRAAELMMLCDWIVASRPGFSLDQAARALPHGIEPVGEAKIHQNYTEQILADAFYRRSTLYLLSDLHEDVSATEIRASLASHAPDQATGDLTDAVLPTPVVDYIRAHALYR